MKTSLFIMVVLVSGALAGSVHGMANLILVEPYLDWAIGIENQDLIESGLAQDTDDFWEVYDRYRDWQKSGQLVAGIVLGMSVGALFGMVFALSKDALPGGNLKKATMLSGIMWCVIYLIPFLKYPANPPTVGDGETVVLRGILYLAFIAMSGLGAAGFYQLSKRLPGKGFIAWAGYAVFITTAFMAMPENPDRITAPDDLVYGFRIASVMGVSCFWAAIGPVFGTLWNRFIADT